MRRRPWMVRVMVLGGLLAVAAGSWFTLTSEDERAAKPVAEPPLPKAMRRMDRRAPMEIGRMGGGSPSPPIPHPAGPGVRSRGSSRDPVASLSDPTAEVRISSAWKLKVSGPTEEALLPLGTCLKDPEAEVRMAAASALGEYADLPAEVVRDLVNLARTDPSSAVALRALWAATGRGSPDLLDAAIGIYRARGMVFTGEKSPPISVLGAVARAGPGGWEFLKGLLRDPDPSVRRDAVQEIPTSWATWPEVRKDPDRIPLLVGMLDDPSPSVRSSAAWALAQSAGDARSAKGRLLELLADDADYGAREYVDALLSIKAAAEKMGPILVRKLASADAKARIAGCDGLERLGPAAGPWKEALRERLEDADPGVRGAAKSLLARLPDR